MQLWPTFTNRNRNRKHTTAVVLACVTLISKGRKKQNTRIWVREWIRHRQFIEAHNLLLRVEDTGHVVEDFDFFDTFSILPSWTKWR